MGADRAEVAFLKEQGEHTNTEKADFERVVVEVCEESE